MNMVVVLVLLSLVLAGVALWAFFWAVNSNQFDDLDSPAMSVLKEDEQEEKEEAEEEKQQHKDDLPPKD